MNLKNIFKKDITWGYISKFVQIASGLILLPIILFKLPSSQVGIYYVFLSINMLVYQLNMGFQPTLMRNISYIYAGAKKLNKTGVDTKQEFNQELDYHLLKKIISTGKIVFLIVGLLGGLVVGVGGSFYISGIIAPLGNNNYIFLAWEIYTLASVLEIIFYYYSPLLMGSGKVLISLRIITFSKILFVLITGILLIFDFGLLAVAIGRMISIILNVILFHNAYFTKKLNLKLKGLVVTKGDIIYCFDILFHTSYKLGLVNFSEYLLNNIPILVAPYMFSIGEVAKLGLIFQLYSIISVLALVSFQINYPIISKFWIKKKFNKLQEYYVKDSLILIVVFDCLLSVV